MVAIGYFVSTGDTQTRRATGLIQPMTNSGPCFAAVAIAFDNDPAILGAVTGILLIQLVGGTIIASYFGKTTKGSQNRPAPDGLARLAQDSVDSHCLMAAPISGPESS
jgi:BASS family bile acid:Na+ symporter